MKTHFFNITAKIPIIIIFYLYLTLITTHISYSQYFPRAKISGKITDASNGAPLQYADIFLSNTTFGDVSDELGNYYLKNLPAGTYELVVSMIGYQTRFLIIHLDDRSDKTYHFRLKIKILETDEIQVLSTVPKEWKKNLKMFEKIFLGTSKNASKCKILNPEFLDFQYEKDSGFLSASASEPLQIENKALGYLLFYHLLDFVSIGGGELKYLGRVKFEELTPANNNEKVKWKNNRQKTYDGSFRHFFSAIASGQLHEEGFSIHGISKIYFKDNFYYIDEITADTLLAPIRNSDKKVLSFSNTMSIIFGQRSSVIELRQPSLLLNLSGRLANPYALVTYGYWTEERIADKLPLDYKK